MEQTKQVQDSLKEEIREKLNQRAEHFNLLEGIHFFRLFWIFLLSSVLGYYLELAWCLMYHGRFYSRQSLVFGPFSVVYGFGAVIITLIIHLIKSKNTGTIFVVTTISGAIFEYLCSYLQELVFGTVSWDYGKQPFTIGGRCNLLFACGWGLLAILFFRKILPLFNQIFVQVQNHRGYLLTCILLAFMLCNMFVSATAVKRQTDRRNGIEPSNAYERYLDRKYPDDVLKRIYANMRVVD
ncbi:putative ABC transporter permease [Anaerosporobacter faecicola]|uniref:putative ABC transporter permease n=1 Tax=Anaerosporobacter faecicola TaxID=2718714 RepID=UPI00143C7A73|nr:putative ABC transporter permease [Anaerosporobacter faecicola]